MATRGALCEHMRSAATKEMGFWGGGGGGYFKEKVCSQTQAQGDKVPAGQSVQVLACAPL